MTSDYKNIFASAVSDGKSAELEASIDLTEKMEKQFTQLHLGQ